MIAKHIPMHAVSRGGFARLVRYLTDTQSKQERIGDIRLTNCFSIDVEGAALEILNTQSANTRSQADKTYHLVVSFRDGEEPDAAALAAIEERICEAMGFGGHQRISVEHRDTDNRHLHIAINKIHPTRYTIHEPYLAYRTLARVCDTLENELALRKDRHLPRKVGAANRATDMEHHAGLESLLGWIQRGCKEQMQHAQSWKEMHAVMAANGLRLHRRANGLVITAQDGTTVKASSVARDFSKPKLEQRYGPFEPAPKQDASIKPRRQYEKRPIELRPREVKLYEQYRAAQTQIATIRKREWERVRERKERKIEAAMRTVRLKRAALKLASMPYRARNLMYGALTKALRDEISEIKRASKQEYMDIRNECQRRQWVDWLRHQAGRGNEDALAVLRRRKPTCNLTRDAMSGAAQLRPTASPRQIDSVTKRGTMIYRAGESTVRDDGDVLRVSRGADQDAMEAALRMALDRFGRRITVNGSSDFKEQVVIAAATAKLAIVFDDPILEQHRLRLTNPASPRIHFTHDVSTRSPTPSDSEGTGPAKAPNYRTPHPGAPQKPKSSGHARRHR